MIYNKQSNVYKRSQQLNYFEFKFIEWVESIKDEKFIHSFKHYTNSNEQGLEVSDAVNHENRKKSDIEITITGKGTVSSPEIEHYLSLADFETFSFSLKMLNISWMPKRVLDDVNYVNEKVRSDECLITDFNDYAKVCLNKNNYMIICQKENDKDYFYIYNNEIMNKSKVSYRYLELEGEHPEEKKKDKAYLKDKVIILKKHAYKICGYEYLFKCLYNLLQKKSEYLSQRNLDFILEHTYEETVPIVPYSEKKVRNKDNKKIVKPIYKYYDGTSETLELDKKVIVTNVKGVI